MPFLVRFKASITKITPKANTRRRVAIPILRQVSKANTFDEEDHNFFQIFHKKCNLNINKQLPPDVAKFNEIPDKSKSYKIVRKKELYNNIQISKYNNLPIPIFQENLFTKYHLSYFINIDV
ncbi:hypothetical protein H8356DRAFT_1339306 [Neocallimastix lanati (nom. inval.)]|nr:hypothetical protein H8356DRAFT_1339306 [Neocallimastix sp. JGI-2020a]